MGIALGTRGKGASAATSRAHYGDAHANATPCGRAFGCCGVAIGRVTQPAGASASEYPNLRPADAEENRRQASGAALLMIIYGTNRGKTAPDPSCT